MTLAPSEAGGGSGPAPGGEDAPGRLFPAAFGILAVVFLLSTAAIVGSRFHEDDHWWFLPCIRHYTEGRSVWEILTFLFGYEPVMMSQPPARIYLWGVLSVLGPSAGNFLAVLVAVHLANALLVVALARAFGWGPRERWAAASVYLGAYGPFESYLWPLNAQHLFVVTSILGGVLLHLRARARFEEGRPWRAAWTAAFLAQIVASLHRQTMVILPLLILVDLWVRTRPPGVRGALFDRWLPFFLPHLGYPLGHLVWRTEIQTKVHLALPGLPAPVSWAILALAGVVFLLLLQIAIRREPRPGLSGTRRALAAVAVLAALLFWWRLVHRDRANVLLPYNAVLPLVTFTMSFLNPLGAVLGFPSWEAYYCVPSQASVLSLLLVAGVIAAFVVRTSGRPEVRAICLAWYAVPLLYLNLYDPIPSRYLAYIAAPASLAIGAAACRAWSLFLSLVGGRLRGEAAAFLLILGAFFGMGLLATKYAMFRGRLPNSFYVYDYLRVASVVREDAGAPSMRRGEGRPVLSIRGIPAMPIPERWSFSPLSPADDWNARAALVQTLGDRYDLEIRIGPGGWKDPPPPGEAAYLVDGDRILDRAGRDVDPFRADLDRGLAAIQEGRFDAAEAAVARAAGRRAFLVNYVMGPHALEDLGWVTDREDLRTWVRRVAGWWDVGDPKAAHVRRVMEQEVDDSIRVLFCHAWLLHRARHRNDAFRWFHRIPYLDRDPDRVRALLAKGGPVSSHPDAAAFLEEALDPARFEPPAWYARERIFTPSFRALFLLKLAFDGRIDGFVDRRSDLYRPRPGRQPAKCPVMPPRLGAGVP